jgi:hypothetical protein
MVGVMPATELLVDLVGLVEVEVEIPIPMWLVDLE